jgi:hypothetical protein
MAKVWISPIRMPVNRGSSDGTFSTDIRLVLEHAWMSRAKLLPSLV